MIEEASRAIVIPSPTPSPQAAPDAGWQALLTRRGGQPGAASPDAELEALFAPLLAPATAPDGARVSAHLGQSLDGYVATRAGDSQWITGAQDVRHTHRMRALAHAVIIGGGTAAADDPRLTVRDCAGEHPVRVVLDPDRRLAPGRKLFDGAAPALLLCAPDAPQGPPPGAARVIVVPRAAGGGLDPAAVIAVLVARGLTHLFIEGGGVTVARFLCAGLLDRLHVAVAPVLLGAGRPALPLPAAEPLARALRVAATHRSLGADVLFDLAIDRARPPAAVAP